MKKNIAKVLLCVGLCMLFVTCVYAKESNEYTEIQNQNMNKFSLKLEGYFFDSVNTANNEFSNMTTILNVDTGKLVFNQDNRKVYKITSNVNDELVFIVQDKEVVYKGVCDKKDIVVDKINSFFEKLNINYEFKI